MSENPADPAGSGRRFCLVASRYNRVITDRLVAGARDALLRRGARPEDIDVVRVPGFLSARPLRAGPSAGKPIADAVLAARFVAEARARRFDVARIDIGAESTPRCCSQSQEARG